MECSSFQDPCTHKGVKYECRNGKCSASPAKSCSATELCKDASGLIRHCSNGYCVGDKVNKATGNTVSCTQNDQCIHEGVMYECIQNICSTTPTDDWTGCTECAPTVDPPSSHSRTHNRSSPSSNNTPIIFLGSIAGVVILAAAVLLLIHHNSGPNRAAAGRRLARPR